MKTCSKCRETRPITEFSRNAATNDGLSHQCKPCVSAYMKVRYAKNRDATIARVGTYRNNNREKVRERLRDYYKRNSKALNAKSRENYAANRERIRAQALQYRKQNAEIFTKKAKEKHRRDPRPRMLWAARDRAKRANLPCAISIDDIVVPATCPVLGIPLIVGDGKIHAGSPTVDKIDPSLGYVPGNIHVISYRANSIKTNATIEELILVGRYFEALRDSRSKCA